MSREKAKGRRRERMRRFARQGAPRQFRHALALTLSLLLAGLLAHYEVLANDAFSPLLPLEVALLC